MSLKTLTQTLTLLCGLALTASAQSNFYGSYAVAGSTTPGDTIIAGQVLYNGAPNSIGFLAWDPNVVTFFIYDLGTNHSVYNSGSCSSPTTLPSAPTPGQTFNLFWDCSGIGQSDGLPYHLVASARLIAQSDGTYLATRGSVKLSAQ